MNCLKHRRECVLTPVCYLQSYCPSKQCKRKRALSRTDQSLSVVRKYCVEKQLLTLSLMSIDEMKVFMSIVNQCAQRSL